MERLKPSLFLKSDGSQRTPNSAAASSPISLSFSAFLSGLIERVVQNQSKPRSAARRAVSRRRRR